MDVIWKKIWRDVSRNKVRSVQVVLSIAVGIFAVGLTIGMYDKMNVVMTKTWINANPSHIHVGTGIGVTRDTIRAIGNLPGLIDAEGYNRMTSRWKLSIDDDWQDSEIIAREDYRVQRYDKLTLIDGTWPVSGGIAVDRGSASKLGISIGDTVLFEVGERLRSLNVVGITYDTWANPPAFNSNASFYATRRDIDRLGGRPGFRVIRAVMAEFDEELAKEKGVEITDRLQDIGIGFGTPEVYDPAKHFFQDTANGIFLLLIVMSILTVALSVFLVTNTITAIVADQVPQIGVMKAVGAQSLTVFRIYFSSVLIYLILSLLLAVPLGIVGATMLTNVMLGLFNMESVGIAISPLAISVQIVLGIASPLIAAAWPVTAGARMTVREAISSYGLSVKIGLVGQLISSIDRLPPLAALTLSNTFRKKGRLIMTLVSLIGGGAIFMMVMSIQTSMIHSFEQLLDTWDFDVLVFYEDPHRVQAIKPLVESFPGVESAELLQIFDTGAKLVGDKEGTSEESIQLMGIPKGGNAYEPNMRTGRFLTPQDSRAVVLNEHLAQEMGIGVGDNIVIEIDDVDTEWIIVGTLFDIAGDQTNSVVWFDQLTSAMKRTGKGSTMFVHVAPDRLKDVDKLSNDLREFLDESGKGVGQSLSAAEVLRENTSSLMIIVYLLLVVAVLIAAVASVGLSGALSISALERRKEVGVMRAIGASGKVAASMFVGEGLIIGLLSWLVSIPISVPLGIVFTNAIGSTIDFQFSFQYSYMGVGIWFTVVVVLSILASGMPAWRASRVSVREVLSYE